jgi:hypothetical protein
MLRLSQGQRTALSDTLRELANLVAGALALSQFVGEQPTSIWTGLAGMGGWVLLVAWALFLAGEQSNG